MVYELTEGLPEADLEQLQKRREDALIVTDSREAMLLLGELGFDVCLELLMKDIYFCKVEAEQDYFCGSLIIPNEQELLGERYRLLFFINKSDLLLVSEDGYAKRVVERLRERRLSCDLSSEKLLYMFLAEVIAGDSVLLERFESELMEMEEQALRRQNVYFLERMLRVRKQLLILRGYYEQLMEVGRELEENENELFSASQLKYFGTVGDRA